MVRKYLKMKQIIKVISICLLIISCNGQVKNKKESELKEDKIQVENTNKQEPPVNFFNQKYFNGYMMSFGDEDISEHPYRYYYNYENKEVQWFSVSYVPKDISLSNYWLNYTQGSNGDEITESSVIEKNVNKDLNAYNIFAVCIPKKYLDISNGESEESMFFKNNTEVYFYLYDISEKKWEFLKKVKTNSPLIGKRDFFYNQFPELFSLDKSLKLNNKKINYLGTKFNIDKIKIKNDLYYSKSLDNIFDFNDGTYSQGTTYVNIDYKYQLETINIVNTETNDIKDVYILSKNDEILCDTLKINKNLIIDTNIIIKKDNNRRAFCLRTSKENKLFAIYILDKNNKIQKMPVKTPIKSAGIINLDDRE